MIQIIVEAFETVVLTGLGITLQAGERHTASFSEAFADEALRQAAMESKVLIENENGDDITLFFVIPTQSNDALVAAINGLEASVAALTERVAALESKLGNGQNPPTPELDADTVRAIAMLSAQAQNILLTTNYALQLRYIKRIPEANREFIYDSLLLSGTDRERAIIEYLTK